MTVPVICYLLFPYITKGRSLAQSFTSWQNATLLFFFIIIIIQNTFTEWKFRMVACSIVSQASPQNTHCYSHSDILKWLTPGFESKM